MPKAWECVVFFTLLLSMHLPLGIVWESFKIKVPPSFSAPRSLIYLALCEIVSKATPSTKLSLLVITDLVRQCAPKVRLSISSYCFYFLTKDIMFSMIFVYKERKSYWLSNNFFIDSCIANGIPNDSSTSTELIKQPPNKEALHVDRAKVLAVDVQYSLKWFYIVKRFWMLVITFVNVWKISGPLVGNDCPTHYISCDQQTFIDNEDYREEESYPSLWRSLWMGRDREA